MPFHRSAKPCIVQTDFTVLLETEHPSFEEARDMLFRFAELVKSPVSVHTYRITPLSLWNAAASGLTAEEVVSALRGYSRWDLPSAVERQIRLWMSRYGKLRLEKAGQTLQLAAADEETLDELHAEKTACSYFGLRTSRTTVSVLPRHRGLLKQELTRLGYPVVDLVGYHEGRPLAVSLRQELPGGGEFRLRDYQRLAADAFTGKGGADPGGSGVLVLPCGAGKTVVGIASMARLQCETLILTSNVTSVRQWKAELLDKTTIAADDVGEYSGLTKQVKPVTIATYHILTHRKRKTDDFSHMKLFNERDWGLIIYDEVHLLPAPVFRATADIQATRRLGLTATLVREDGCEKDVFSLIGPKRLELPWKRLEREGWIARVRCREIRLPLRPPSLERYRLAEPKHQFRIACENPDKLHWVCRLLAQHDGVPTLVIGQYLDQLRLISEALSAQLITGSMPQERRNELYAEFRSGAIKLLVVSKVANFAVDLPDATVLIQISGSYGSRQEEAQRLGRILRPKRGGSDAYFYTLVSSHSKEQDFAIKRQLFLVEQGYTYEIETVGEDAMRRYQEVAGT
ncbi:hypothetical protein PAE9249_02601 [Paenibacillus sp. CECT 9249]|uniref:DNA repair helicase XPB n=1 Tax=Paenibacillus sp. CECT 9249 TaxID=2845385 RepID=UPI001E3D5291|nr:DNA repair helicase XPB [Paenibacillus sp. CECT 9249]CAH0120088.1 hypothetical protein PAE9249_02601 [Paenibacillus sp. CECT 9249]